MRRFVACRRVRPAAVCHPPPPCRGRWSTGRRVVEWTTSRAPASWCCQPSAGERVDLVATRHVPWSRALPSSRRALRRNEALHLGHLQWRARWWAQPPQGWLWACVGRRVAQISGVRAASRPAAGCAPARAPHRTARPAGAAAVRRVNHRPRHRRVRDLCSVQHRTGDGGSGQPRLGLEEPARCHARPDVAQQARRHPALGLHVVHPLSDEHRGNLRATPNRSISLTDWAKPWRRPRRPR
jgi:hypothetical protein